MKNTGVKWRFELDSQDDDNLTSPGVASEDKVKLLM